MWLWGEGLDIFALLGFYSFWSLRTADSHLAGQGCRGLLSSSPGQGCVLFSGIIFIELQVHPSVLPASCGLKAGIIPKLPISAGLFVGNWLLSPLPPQMLTLGSLHTKSVSNLARSSPIPFAPWSQACSLRGYKLSVCGWMISSRGRHGVPILPHDASPLWFLAHTHTQEKEGTISSSG